MPNPIPITQRNKIIELHGAGQTVSETAAAIGKQLNNVISLLIANAYRYIN